MKNICQIILLQTLILSCSSIKHIYDYSEHIEFVNSAIQNINHIDSLELFIKSSKFFDDKYNITFTKPLSFSLKTFRSIAERFHKYDYDKFKIIGIENIDNYPALPESEETIGIIVMVDTLKVGLSFNFVQINKKWYYVNWSLFVHKDKEIETRKMDLLNKIIEKPENIVQIVKDAGFYKEGLSFLYDLKDNKKNEYIAYISEYKGRKTSERIIRNSWMLGDINGPIIWKYEEEFGIRLKNTDDIFFLFFHFIDDNWYLYTCYIENENVRDARRKNLGY
jgi:hypothetical protein